MNIKHLVELLELIVTVLLFSHFFACVWIKIASMERSSGSSSWVGHDELMGYDDFIKALYFATVTMITVGYGDITPIN